MKVIINAGDKEFHFDLPKENVVAMIEQAYKHEGKEAGKQVDIIKERETLEEPKEHPQRGYKGFMIIRCPKCGKTRGFYQRTLATEYQCFCGKPIHLEKLRPVFLECKGCGESLKYRTNIKDDTFDFPCVECKNLVTLTLNKHKNAYVTSPEK